MHNRFSEFYSFMTSDFTTNSLCYLFLSDAVAMNHAFQSFLNFFVYMSVCMEYSLNILPLDV